MDQELTRKIELLTSNRKLLGDSIMMSHDLDYVISSMILTALDKEADVEIIKEARQILAGKVSMLSSFRETMEMTVATKMSVAGDPETYIDDVLEVFRKLLGKRVIEPYSMVLAAMAIVDMGRKNETDAIISKMHELMNAMTHKHPFLTDDNDIIFAVLLAMTDKDVDTIIKEMEECYVYLRKTVRVKADSNAIQGLCEIIMLSDGDYIAKCDKAVGLFDAFAERGAKYGSYYEFASLGALVPFDMDMNELVDTIIEVSGRLKPNRGFTSWSMSDRQRLMFAAMVVADVLPGNRDMAYEYAVKGAVVGNTVAEIVAEEMAAMAAVMVIANSN